MKIVFLTRDIPLSKSQIRLVHERHPVAAVIYEGNPSMKSRIRRRLEMRSTSDLVVGVARRGMREAVSAVGLGKRSPDLGLLPEPTLPDGIAVHPICGVNSPEATQCLRDLAPDVVLVRGTGLIRDEVVATVPLMLNVHAGLSPYYRGSHCTEWALLNWDPYNIGATVHRITRSIDGGAVFGQARVTVEPSDTVGSINEKICYEGSHLFIRALDHLATGAALPMHEQDRRLGTLRLGMHWDAQCESHVRSLTTPDVLTAMLKRPIRRQLPIIEPAEVEA